MGRARTRRACLGDRRLARAAKKKGTRHAHAHGAIAWGWRGGERRGATSRAASRGHGDAGIPVVLIKRAALEPVFAALEQRKAVSAELEVALTFTTAPGVQRRGPVARRQARRARRARSLVGAHYDHLGPGGHYSLAPESHAAAPRRRRQRVGHGGAARGGAHARGAPAGPVARRRVRGVLRRGGGRPRLHSLHAHATGGAGDERSARDDQPRHGGPPAREPRDHPGCVVGVGVARR